MPLSLIGASSVSVHVKATVPGPRTEARSQRKEKIDDQREVHGNTDQMMIMREEDASQLDSQPRA